MATTIPTKTSDFGFSSSTSSSLNEFTSKYTTLQATSSSPPPPSLLSASVTSLSAPAPPDDKLTEKSDVKTVKNIKIEVEGKLLPILRSGIPQSIQLAEAECEIPSLVDYYAHFLAQKFATKTPYLYSNIHTIGGVKYPNGISGNNKYSVLNYPQGVIGRESVTSLLVHQLPPPPPPPSPNIMTAGLKYEIKNSKGNAEPTIISEIKENEDTIVIDEDTGDDSSDNVVNINDHVAPISIPLTKSKADPKSGHITVVSTKLRPPPPTLPHFSEILDIVEVSDSVAPKSIPKQHSFLKGQELQGPSENKSKGQKKILHHPPPVTTFYHVLNDDKEISPPSYSSRPRPWNIGIEPKNDYEDATASANQKYYWGKLPTHNTYTNNYLKYRLVSGDNPKWLNKSKYLSTRLPIGFDNNKRPHPHWPPIHHQQYHISQSHPNNKAVLSQTTYHPSQHSYAPHHPQLNAQNPSHKILPYSHNLNPPTYQNSSFVNSEIGQNVEFITENNITNEKVRNKIIGSNNTEKSSLMGNDSLIQRKVTMHHLSSDEQLTILKVDQNEDANTSPTKNDTESTISNTTVASRFEGNFESTPILDNVSSSVDTNVGKTNEEGKNNMSNYSNLKKDHEKKVDYIVLHKLPNGEALDLENMKTYTMLDLDTEIVQKNQNGILHHKEDYNNEDLPPTNNRSENASDLTMLASSIRRNMPRSIDHFPNNSSTGLKKDGTQLFNDLSKHKEETLKDIDQGLMDNKDQQNEEKIRKESHDNQTNGSLFDREVLESYMSETPEDIEKLKVLMMESSDKSNNNQPREDLDEDSPMYIITEEDYMKHKSTLREQNKHNGNENDLQVQEDDISSSVDSEQTQQKPVMEKLINQRENVSLEMLPTPEKYTLAKNDGFVNSNYSETTDTETFETVNSNGTTNRSLENVDQLNIKRMDSNLEYHWTPIPQQEFTSTTQPIVFGPQLPPEGYIPPEEVATLPSLNKPPIDVSEIDKLSKIAYVTLTDDKDSLAANIKEIQEDLKNRRKIELHKHKQNKTIIETEADTLVNVQLLPPRLSAVLTHVNHHLPHRSSVKVPPLPNAGATSPKERSFGHYNPHMHSSPSYGSYGYGGQFRQNKIAPIFKEDEMHSITSQYNVPIVASSSHEASLSHLSEITPYEKQSFSVKQPYHSSPYNYRPSSPTSMSAEPRSYTLHHGRQNNARRINYPPSNSNQHPPPHPTPKYQTQIVPGIRDQHRYIPLHTAKPTTKKKKNHLPIHHSPGWWRSRQYGFQGRKHQQNRYRLPHQFHAKMLKPLPTYASVEISRSSKRKVSEKENPLQSELEEPISPDAVEDEVESQTHVLKNDAIFSKSLSERKLLAADTKENKFSHKNQDNEKGSLNDVQAPSQHKKLRPL